MGAKAVIVATNPAKMVCLNKNMFAIIVFPPQGNQRVIFVKS